MSFAKYKITTKQLVEYMDSNAIVRNRILKEIFDQSGFKPYYLWYEEYKAAFAEYMKSQDFVPSFEGLKSSLTLRKVSTSQEEQKIIKQLHAIDLTSKIQVFQNLHGAKCFSLLKDHRQMVIGEMIVKCGATNFVQSTNKFPHRVGLIFPYLKSTKPLSVDAAKIHGVLLHWFSESQLSKFGKAAPNICITVDIFNSQTTIAPSAFKKIRTEITANCNEISARLLQLQNQFIEISNAPIITGKIKRL